MKKILIATFAAGTMLALAPAANAMPLGGVSPSAGSEITLVAGGCGPGFHRGPYGGCRPNGFFRGGPRFGRPGFYGRPYFHRGPYGYRRF